MATERAPVERSKVARGRTHSMEPVGQSTDLPDRGRTPVIDRSTFVPYLINQIANLMNLPFKRDLKKNRMSHAHWTVLAILAQRDRQSLNEISRDAVIDQSSLSRIIDQMIERKLVVRSPREDDGRFVSISMTSLGWQRFLELSKVAFAHADDLTEGIGEKELQQFRSTLLKILRRLEARRQE